MKSKRVRILVAGVAGVALLSFGYFWFGRRADANPKGKQPVNPGVARTKEPRSKNVRLVGWTDMDGRPDAEQLVGWGNYLYVGHYWSQGTSVVDISNPANPRVVAYIPTDDPGAWHVKTQVYGNILIRGVSANIFAHPPRKPTWTGLQIYDVSDPTRPKHLADLKLATEFEGMGTHKFWFNDGKYVHIGTPVNGYKGNIYVIADVSAPTNPKEVSRWWWPGQWEAGGEQFKPEDLVTEGSRSIGAHTGTTNRKGNLGFYTDLSGLGGLITLDLSDYAKPKFLSRLDLSPPFPWDYFGVHQVTDLASRGLIVIADESGSYQCKNPRTDIWLVDINDPKKPVVTATFPVPLDHDCSKAVRFGPHNQHENRAGSLIDDWMSYHSYFNGGLRIYDLSNPYFPQEVGFYEPPDPDWKMDERPLDVERFQGSDLMALQDIWVAPNGLIYATDYNAGLFVFEYMGPRPDGSRKALAEATAALAAAR